MQSNSLLLYRSIENALRRVDAAFELFQKLGVCEQKTQCNTTKIRVDDHTHGVMILYQQ